MAVTNYRPAMPRVRLFGLVFAACLYGGCGAPAELQLREEPQPSAPRSALRAELEQSRSPAAFSASPIVEEPPMDAAERRYREACKLDRAAGCYAFGMALFGGHGVRKDQRRGRELLDIACSAGQVEACRFLTEVSAEP